jgi:hypothetical protein
MSDKIQHILCKSVITGSHYLSCVNSRIICYRKVSIKYENVFKNYLSHDWRMWHLHFTIIIHALQSNRTNALVAAYRAVAHRSLTTAILFIIRQVREKFYWYHIIIYFFLYNDNPKIIRTIIFDYARNKNNCIEQQSIRVHERGTSYCRGRERCIIGGARACNTGRYTNTGPSRVLRVIRHTRENERVAMLIYIGNGTALPYYSGWSPTYSRCISLCRLLP